MAEAADELETGVPTVEVEGDPMTGARGVYPAVAPGFTPFAFTNPIFIDLLGDGFDPPGLPVGPTPRVAAKQQRYSIETLDLSTLSEDKRHQVTGHMPIHKLTIPAEAVEQLNESSDAKPEAPTAPQPAAPEAEKASDAGDLTSESQDSRSDAS